MYLSLYSWAITIIDWAFVCERTMPFLYYMKNDFQKDYWELTKYARAIIAKFKSTLTPDDLINSAYVDWFDSNAPYSIDTFRKIMFNSIKTDIEYHQANVSIEAIGLKSKEIETDYCCIKCNEIKPSSQFVLFIKSRNIKVTYRKCRDCRLQYYKDYNYSYYPKKKNNRDYKDLRNKHSKNYIDKIRPQHNKNVVNYNLKQKEILSDIYIKTLLRAERTPQEITPQRIREKRQKVIDRLIKEGKDIQSIQTLYPTYIY